MKQILLAVLTSMFLVWPAYASTMVDVELVLAVDVSGSVSSSEYALQLQGYVDAFRDSNVQAAVLGGDYGSIAVTYFEWDRGIENSQNWYQLGSVADIETFATLLEGLSNDTSGTTYPNIAVYEGLRSLSGNDYDGTRQVIDVSGDGEGYSASGSEAARAAAESAGVTVNGIAIESGSGNTEVLDWYTAHLITSDGFAMDAATFEDFGDAIKQKLIAEITGGGINHAPEPATALLFGIGVLGLAGVNRKQ
jgi:hypothetical protein